MGRQTRSKSKKPLPTKSSPSQHVVLRTKVKRGKTVWIEEEAPASASSSPINSARTTPTLASSSPIASPRRTPGKRRSVEPLLQMSPRGTDSNIEESTMLPPFDGSTERQYIRKKHSGKVASLIEISHRNCC